MVGRVWSGRLEAGLRVLTRRCPSLRSGLSSAGIDKHLADRARKSPLIAPGSRSEASRTLNPVITIGGGDDNGRPKTEKEP
jgi:hypothetical protein